MSKVSFIKSDDRIYNIERCLSLIKSEIMSGLRNTKRVVVKPNCVVGDNQLAATHVDALDAVLDFIKPYVKSQIVLAEGSAECSTMEAFEKYGYLKLQEKYDFTIVDLNTDEFETIDLVDKSGKTWSAQIAKTIINSDYLISVSPPKTHDNTVYTGVIKNVCVGSLLKPRPSFTSKFIPGFKKIRDNKSAIHQGYPAINENIARIFKQMPIKLAVLDGFESMQGNGPINGEMVPTHYAMASSDPLSADWLACQLMGIKIEDVGYLTLLGANKIEPFIIGDDWRSEVTEFKMHDKFEEIKKWR